jgi:hypothetical protein
MISRIILTTPYGTLSGTIETMSFFHISLRTSDPLSKNIAKRSFLMHRHDGDDIIILVPVQTEQNTEGNMPSYYSK